MTLFIKEKVQVLWQEEAIINDANDLPRGIVVIRVNKDGYPLIGTSGRFDKDFKRPLKWQAYLVSSDTKFGQPKFYRFNLEWTRLKKMEPGEKPIEIDDFDKKAKFLPAFFVDYKDLDWENTTYIIFCLYTGNNNTIGFVRVKRKDMGRSFQSIGRGVRGSYDKFVEICKDILKEREDTELLDLGKSSSEQDKKTFKKKIYTMGRDEFLFIPVSFT